MSVAYLQGMDQLDFTSLYDSELAPVPTSLDTGERHFMSPKAALKNQIKVSSCGIVNVSTLVDGGGMLYSFIHCPKESFVKNENNWAARQFSPQIVTLLLINSLDTVLSLRHNWKELVFSKEHTAFKEHIKISLDPWFLSIHFLDSLIPLHSLSGFDAVLKMFDIGKANALSAAEKCTWQLFGEENANITEVNQETRRFVTQCYVMNKKQVLQQ